MSKKKKSGNKETALKAIILVTAILNLINALMAIINRLLDSS